MYITTVQHLIQSTLSAAVCHPCRAATWPCLAAHIQFTCALATLSPTTITYYITTNSTIWYTHSLLCLSFILFSASIFSCSTNECHPNHSYCWFHLRGHTYWYLPGFKICIRTRDHNSWCAPMLNWPSTSSEDILQTNHSKYLFSDDTFPKIVNMTFDHPCLISYIQAVHPSYISARFSLFIAYRIMKSTCSPTEDWNIQRY